MDEKKHTAPVWKDIYAVDGKKQKNFGYGYTTGSCAAAAAQAATRMLLTGRKSGRGGFTDTKRNFTASADRGDFHG